MKYRSNRQIAERLQVAGMPICLEEILEDLIIRQGAGPSESIISVAFLPGGASLCHIITYLKLINRSPVPLCLSNFYLSLAWTNELITLLSDPAEVNSPEIYRFPGQKDGGFARHDVIPRSGRTLRRGQSVHGFLLGYHPDPLPTEFLHGSTAHAVVTIEDQFGDSYSKEIALMVDRSAERTFKPKPVPTRQGLMDCRDKTPVK